MIDLHTHSTASDGTDSPAELVAAASAAGLRTIALTDHDTSGGWQEAANAAAALPHPFSLLPGTEFSCVHTTAVGRRISMHLLGYLYDRSAPELTVELTRLRTDRLERGAAIVAKLESAGYPISWEQVIALADGGAVGRPHIGRALVEAGVVPSVDAAFADLLASSSSFYVGKQDLPVIEAIGLIRGAGGVPVIAHPWARTRGVVLEEADLVELIAAGMLGIEVDHPDHAPADRVRLRELADEYGVFVTGSSDYHGTNKRIWIGAEHTSPDNLERLVDAASGSAVLRTCGR